MEDSWKENLSEIERVALAAKSRGLTEFELFEEAYRRWYARDGVVQEIEGHFARYLLEADVPFWVRHFLRDIPLERNTGFNGGENCRLVRAFQMLELARLMVFIWLGVSHPVPPDQPAFILVA